jgi:hypothetical protein
MSDNIEYLVRIIDGNVNTSCDKFYIKPLSKTFNDTTFQK